MKKPKSKNKKSAPRKKKPAPQPDPPVHDDSAEIAAELGDDEGSEGDEEEETAKKRDTRKKTGKRGIGPAEDREETEAATPAKKGRQARLPEMEDPEIEELEECAERYQDIRIQRQRLTAKEVEAKTELLALMKSHNKREYNHAGCEISVIVEKEKVRVRINKED